MQSQTKRSTRPSVSTPTRNPIPRIPASGRGGRRRPPAENAFSAAYLEQARRLEEPPFQREALYAGPWDVEPVAAGDGELHAVVRKGDPVAEGGRAVAVFLRRPDALLAAAALTALSTPNRLSLNAARTGATRRPLGFPVHDGTQHLGHLSRPEEDFLPLLHAVRCLTANPDALALTLEALGPELPPILGRILMRRLDG